jgi:hypothetical protein
MGDAAEANAAERSIEMWKIKKARTRRRLPPLGEPLGRARRATRATTAAAARRDKPTAAAHTALAGCARAARSGARARRRPPRMPHEGCAHARVTRARRAFVFIRRRICALTTHSRARSRS